PVQVVVVPIFRKDEERALVMERAREIAGALRPLRVHVDDRENLSPGAKFYEWELKGVPFRVEIGPKDIAKQQVVLVRRVAAEGEERKQFIPETVLLGTMEQRLEEYQRWLLERARRRREENSHRGVETWDRLRELIEGPGGFVYTGFCGSPECEARVKDELKATSRVMPGEEFRSPQAPATCVVCGAPSQAEIIWARAY
ncbi:MAG TPA: His/Gly/Thr/Pro-type tRNA ligase C-terminal domain-containing protein, partial [Longimicrobiaceae bacterium]|nr:His/Gly/Thr/Pro-type tRNA ligase C-terminal domain-containing protein [Longimicrobiaceae bacterium]